MKKFAVCMTALLWLSVAPAQEENADDTSAVEEIRRYTVEVIIFRYAEDVGLGTERFYPDPRPVEPDDDAELDRIDEVEVQPASRRMDLLTYAVNADALQFALLSEDEYTMTNTLDRFELLDAYETILHAGWAQPALAPELAQPVDLRILGPVPERLEGMFTLYLSRYLHLVVDLSLAAEPEDRGNVGLEETVPSFGDPVSQYIDPAPADELPIYYRIQEDRIVKNGDIRYFDHPKFGIVAKVTLVEPEPPAPADGTDLLVSPRQ
jgi:hypothetical protein